MNRRCIVCGQKPEDGFTYPQNMTEANKWQNMIGVHISTENLRHHCCICNKHIDRSGVQQTTQQQETTNRTIFLDKRTDSDIYYNQRPCVSFNKSKAIHYFGDSNVNRAEDYQRQHSRYHEDSQPQEQQNIRRCQDTPEPLQICGNMALNNAGTSSTNQKQYAPKYNSGSRLSPHTSSSTVCICGSYGRNNASGSKINIRRSSKGRKIKGKEISDLKNGRQSEICICGSSSEYLGTVKNNMNQMSPVQSNSCTSLMRQSFKNNICCCDQLLANQPELQQQKSSIANQRRPLYDVQILRQQQPQQKPQKNQQCQTCDPLLDNNPPVNLCQPPSPENVCSYNMKSNYSLNSDTHNCNNTSQMVNNTNCTDFSLVQPAASAAPKICPFSCMAPNSGNNGTPSMACRKQPPPVNVLIMGGSMLPTYYHKKENDLEIPRFTDVCVLESDFAQERAIFPDIDKPKYTMCRTPDERQSTNAKDSTKKASSTEVLLVGVSQSETFMCGGTSGGNSSPNQMCNQAPQNDVKQNTLCDTDNQYTLEQKMRIAELEKLVAQQQLIQQSIQSKLVELQGKAMEQTILTQSRCTAGSTEKPYALSNQSCFTGFKSEKSVTLLPNQANASAALACNQATLSLQQCPLFLMPSPTSMPIKPISNGDPFKKQIILMPNQMSLNPTPDNGEFYNCLARPPILSSHQISINPMLKILPIVDSKEAK